MSVSDNASASYTETERLQALATYDILDMPTQKEFDDVVKLASQLCNVPVSMISLVDQNRQWFIAEQGLGIREMPIDLSVCRYAIDQPNDRFEIPNTLEDPRFVDHPLVAGQPEFRFYSSAVLRTPQGLPVGTLCVLDYQPRQLTEDQYFALQTLANQVMTQLELRRTLKEREQEKQAAEQWQRVYETVLTNTPDFIYVIGPDKRFVYANDALLKIYGQSLQEVAGKSFYDLNYEPWHAALHESEIEQVVQTRQSVRNRIPFTGTNGRRIYDYIFSPVFDKNGDVTAIAGTTRDITEQEETTQALLLSEERRAVALEASDFIGIWDWDITTDIVQSDERFARLYSVDPELAAHGAPLKEFIKRFHPGDLARVGLAIEQIKQHGGIFHEEYRLIQADGSVRWVVAKGRAQLDEDGKPVRLPGVAIDITERKAAEEKLSTTEDDFRFAQMAGGIGIFSLDLTTKIVSVTPEFCRLFGIPTSETTRADLIEALIHPDDLAIRSLEKTDLMNKPDLNVEYRIRRSHDQALRWISRRARFVYNDQHEPIQLLGIVQDVTEQKMADAVLNKAMVAADDARAHLSLMLESAQDYAIISLDIEGRVTIWNQGAERIFGYEQDEIVGQPVDLIFTPEDRVHESPAYEMAMAAKQGRTNDERWHMRKNGERFYVSGTMASMRGQDGQIKGYIKIARDMTQERYAQEALVEARNAAEAANIAKTEFLANMSHEIRTPMNAVIGLSNILAISQPLTEKQKDFIKTLQMSADSLLSLINDLLDIAKIEARTVDLESVPFSLTQLTQEVISMMGVRVREKNLTFTGDSQCGVHKMFMGDPTRLRQIVLNLCSNAIKFTEKGGVHIDITCQPGADQETELVRIAVRDSGIGIPADKLDTIFHKFTQADSSINRKYGGTGLGLAITMTLTEIMGGKLSVESTVGQGSLFTVEIPMQRASDLDVQATDLSLSETFKQSVSYKSVKKILLVEDYAPNVLVAMTFLESFGYECDVAHNGIEAIEKAKTGLYALALMDVQMHGMNGLEATQMIRELERQQNKPHLPIIGMTAHALMGDKERCLASGMDDYIAKPFNPAELKNKLEQLTSLVLQLA